MQSLYRRKRVEKWSCTVATSNCSSGKQMTPGGAYEIMEILGKEESLARIRKGIEMLSEAADEE